MIENRARHRISQTTNATNGTSSTWLTDATSWKESATPPTSAMKVNIVTAMDASRLLRPTRGPSRSRTRSNVARPLTAATRPDISANTQMPITPTTTTIPSDSPKRAPTWALVTMSPMSTKPPMAVRMPSATAKNLFTGSPAGCRGRVLERGLQLQQVLGPPVPAETRGRRTRRCRGRPPRSGRRSAAQSAFSSWSLTSDDRRARHRVAAPTTASPPPVRRCARRPRARSAGTRGAPAPPATASARGGRSARR